MDCELIIPAGAAKDAVRWIDAIYGALVRPEPISEGIICFQLGGQGEITITEKMEGADILSIYFSNAPKDCIEFASEAARFFNTKVFISDKSLDPNAWIEVDGHTARSVQLDWSKKKPNQPPQT